jgi:predicted nucleic-acid-binding protein
VISLDTNILVRWITRDDAAQTALADQMLAQPCWICASVLVELGWVLETSARLSRDQLSYAVNVLLSLPMVQVENMNALRWAIERYNQGADWADMIHLANSGVVTVFATFDKRLSRQAGPNPPIAIKTLRT